MVAILRLVWGLLSKVLPSIGLAAASATSLFVASAAARALAVSAAILAFVLWLPMPTWVSNLPVLVAGIPEGVVFLMSYARLKEGVAIVLGAMALRFVARLVLKAIS